MPRILECGFGARISSILRTCSFRAVSVCVPRTCFGLRRKIPHGTSVHVTPPHHSIHRPTPFLHKHCVVQHTLARLAALRSARVMRTAFFFLVASDSLSTKKMASSGRSSIAPPSNCWKGEGEGGERESVRG